MRGTKSLPIVGQTCSRVFTALLSPSPPHLGRFAYAQVVSGHLLDSTLTRRIPSAFFAFLYQYFLEEGKILHCTLDENGSDPKSHHRLSWLGILPLESLLIRTPQSDKEIYLDSIGNSDAVIQHLIHLDLL
jgi:hypothetical protein